MGFTEWMEEIERKRRIREQIKSLRNQMGTIDSEIITMGEVIYFYTDYKRKEYMQDYHVSIIEAEEL